MKFINSLWKRFVVLASVFALALPSNAYADERTEIIYLSDAQTIDFNKSIVSIKLKSSGTTAIHICHYSWPSGWYDGEDHHGGSGTKSMGGSTGHANIFFLVPAPQMVKLI